MDEATATGSARAQADLWSVRARDWAEVMEGWNGWGVPLYRHVLDRVALGDGQRVLDVGCGAGRFCRMAADRGADVAGLDATPAFVAIARERVRGADIRVGDMESLPWEEDAFDVTTGFNSFFIAADMTAALREAGRVTKPSGSVAMTVFGRPERCYSTQVFEAVAALLPPLPASPDSGPALHEDGALEAIATEAGLEPREAGFIGIEEHYPDLATLLRGLTAAPPMVRAAAAAGDDAVRGAIAAAVAGHEGADGEYRMREELRWLIAAA